MGRGRRGVSMIRMSASFLPFELAQIAIERYGAMQKTGELAQLVELLEHRGMFLRGSLLEIGSGNGGTTWLWSKLAAMKLVCIDLPGGPWGGGPSKETIERIASNSSAPFSFLAADSHSDIAITYAASKGSYDFIFIDGDHSYEGVKLDYENYKPLLREGGIIAFHDIVEHPPELKCDVHRFWQERKAECVVSGKRWIEIIDPNGGPWGGIGVLLDEHP